MPGPHGFTVRVSIARLARLDRSRGSSRPAIPSVRHAAASTASRPNVRDDGQRPSSGQDGGTSSFDLPDGRSEIFLLLELDTISENPKCFARRAKLADP